MPGLYQAQCSIKWIKRENEVEDRRPVRQGLMDMHGLEADLLYLRGPALRLRLEWPEKRLNTVAPS